MLIQNVQVKNFRSILNESLPCDSLTALVGRNGSGESSFLSALELFYNPTARVTPEVSLAPRTGPRAKVYVRRFTSESLAHKVDTGSGTPRRSTTRPDSEAKISRPWESG